MSPIIETVRRIKYTKVALLILILTLFRSSLSHASPYSNEKAKQLCAEHKTDAAIAEYKRLLRLYPGDGCLLGNLAVCAIKRSRYQTAEEALTELEKLGSDSYLYHQAAGELAYKRDDYKKAKLQLSRAVELNPVGRDYYLLARNAELSKENPFPYWRLATKYYRQESLQPEFSPKEWNDYAAAAWGAQMFQESYEAFSKTLEIEPHNEQALKFIDKAKEKILANRRHDLSVIFLIDKSRSMLKNVNFPALIEDINYVLQLLPDTDYVGVYGFDSVPFRLVPLAQLGTQRTQISSRMKLLFPIATSNLAPALQVLKELEQQKTRKHAILISDGLVGSDTSREFLNKQMIELNKRGISLSIVKVGAYNPHPSIGYLEKMNGVRLVTVRKPNRVSAAIYRELDIAARQQ